MREECDDDGSSVTRWIQHMDQKLCSGSKRNLPAFLGMLALSDQMQASTEISHQVSREILKCKYYSNILHLHVCIMNFLPRIRDTSKVPFGPYAS